MKINFRLCKKNTSITLRNDMVALWLLMNDYGDDESNEEKVLDFVDKCLDSWRLNIARGFSDHVYNCMYEDILERKDYLKFLRILEKLS